MKDGQIILWIVLKQKTKELEKLGWQESQEFYHPKERILKWSDKFGIALETKEMLRF